MVLPSVKRDNEMKNNLKKELFTIDLSYRKGNYDIIIIAGQSNAEGCGKGYNEYKYIPHKPIYGYNGKGFIGLACDKKYGPFNTGASFATYFADEYYKSGALQNGRKIFLLNAAVGGTGFSDNRWGNGDDLSERMILLAKKLLEKNIENKIVCVLWHQGEADVMNKISSDIYYRKLNEFIQNVRNHLGNDVPFISGNMVPSWMKENVYSYAIADKTKKLMNDLSGCSYVDSDELDGNQIPDNIHFSRKSCAELGKRYFDKYIELKRCGEMI